MWLMRLVNSANDAQGMLDELLCTENTLPKAHDSLVDRARLRSRKRFE
jgi:hypothetical protein